MLVRSFRIVAWSLGQSLASGLVVRSNLAALLCCVVIVDSVVAVVVAVVAVASSFVLRF